MGAIQVLKGVSSQGLCVRPAREDPGTFISQSLIHPHNQSDIGDAARAPAGPTKISMRAPRAWLLGCCWIGAVSVANAVHCEEWCRHPCAELTGNVRSECGTCRPEDGFLCHFEADGWDVTREPGKPGETETLHASVEVIGAMALQDDEPLRAVNSSELEANAQGCATIPGWFHGFDLIEYAVLNLVAAAGGARLRIVEVGSYLGMSACFTSHLLRLLGVEADLHAVDIWSGHEDWVPAKDVQLIAEHSQTAGDMLGAFRHFMDSANATYDEALLHKSDSVNRTLLGTFAPESIHFLYLDSGHSEAGTLEELTLWWPKMVVGGWVCGDDFNMPGVQRGVARFAEAMRGTEGVSEVFEWKPDSQFCIGKASEPRQPPGYRRWCFTDDPERDHQTNHVRLCAGPS